MREERWDKSGDRRTGFRELRRNTERVSYQDMYADPGRKSAEAVGLANSGCHLSFDALPYFFDKCSSVG